LCILRYVYALCITRMRKKSALNQFPFPVTRHSKTFKKVDIQNDDKRNRDKVRHQFGNINMNVYVSMRS